MSVKLIGFRCHGVRPNDRLLAEPDAADMARYEATIRATGLENLLLV